MSKTYFIILAILATFLLSQSAFAERGEFVTYEDGATIDMGNAAFLVFAGYPKSYFSYIAGVYHYVNVGFQVDASYEPGFVLGVPVKAQLLESEGKKLNLALKLLPGFAFDYEDKVASFLFVAKPGISAGVRFHEIAGWFVGSEYHLWLPVSDNASFDHYPDVQTGFEVWPGSIVTLIFKGIVEFRGYDSSSFVYGGFVGIGFGIWN